MRTKALTRKEIRYYSERWKVAERVYQGLVLRFANSRSWKNIQAKRLYYLRQDEFEEKAYFIGAGVRAFMDLMNWSEVTYITNLTIEEYALHFLANGRIESEDLREFFETLHPDALDALCDSVVTGIQYPDKPVDEYEEEQALISS